MVEKKKTSVLTKWILLVIVVLLFIIAYGILTDANWFYNIIGKTSISNLKTVKYEVSGSANYAMVTYMGSNTSISQIGKTALPWSIEIDLVKGSVLSLNAQNQDDRGSVKVCIYVNGILKEQSESSGAYVVAQVSAIAE